MLCIDFLLNGNISQKKNPNHETCCVCADPFTHGYKHTHTHTHTHTDTHTCVCVCVCAYNCPRINLDTHTCTHVIIMHTHYYYAHTHTHTDTHTHTYTQTLEERQQLQVSTCVCAREYGHAESVRGRRPRTRYGKFLTNLSLSLFLSLARSSIFDCLRNSPPSPLPGLKDLSSLPSPPHPASF